MPNYNFTKIKKAKTSNERLSKVVRITKSYISVAGDVFNRDHVYVKFDVDTSKKAIRVRQGTEGGSRSYSLRKNDISSSQAIGTQLPASIRDLLKSGKLARGTYKQVKDSNVFVLV